ncbi:hypothetical protein AKJ16_DCAP08037 [Drosera capensis]
MLLKLVTAIYTIKCLFGLGWLIFALHSGYEHPHKWWLLKNPVESRQKGEMLLRYQSGYLGRHSLQMAALNVI